MYKHVLKDFLTPNFHVMELERGPENLDLLIQSNLILILQVLK